MPKIAGDDDRLARKGVGCPLLDVDDSEAADERPEHRRRPADHDRDEELDRDLEGLDLVARSRSTRRAPRSSRRCPAYSALSANAITFVRARSMPDRRGRGLVVAHRDQRPAEAAARETANTREQPDERERRTPSCTPTGPAPTGRLGNHFGAASSVRRQRHQAGAAGALHEPGREVGEDHREPERHQREIQALDPQRREADERADDERDEPRRPAASRGTTWCPNVTPNQCTGGPSAAPSMYAPIAEERAVPDRHLPVVAREHVEAHRRDTDVQRLRERARCRSARSGAGSTSRRTTAARRRRAPRPRDPIARCWLRVITPAPRAWCRTSPDGPEQQHEQDQPERHEQVDARAARGCSRW